MATRPRIVELVGPAGAGKSTLLGACRAAGGAAVGLRLWGLPRRDLAVGALRVLPFAVQAATAGRPLAGAELAQMIRLVALRRATVRAARSGDGLVLLDEGPVFALSWLAVFFAADDGDRRARWRRRAALGWARCLDVVVRIDAANPELARRIRGRDKPHMVKDRSDAEIHAFADRFRRAFDQVIADLAANGPVTVLGLPNDAMPPTTGAVRLRALLDGVGHGH